MRLTDRDPNASGRASRASDMSAGSRGVPKGPGRWPGFASGGQSGQSDLSLLSDPAVTRMLRTDTEFGDFGGIGYGTSNNMPNMPQSLRRSGAPSRMSTSSSHSNTSRRDSRHPSGQHAYPPASSGARYSNSRNSNVPQYAPDTLSPTVMNIPGSSPLVPRARNSRDGLRSQSMTHSQPNLGLTSNRSYTSLRSHGHGQRPLSPVEGYPDHLRQTRRPDMRPASPAMSDLTGSRPRRHQRNRAQAQVVIPPDMPVRRDHRGHVTLPPLPARNRSPAYVANPYTDPNVPPMPSMPAKYRRMVGEHMRGAHTPAKASVSSGSTNRRTDSEAPSSDGPFPPTPRDGTPMGHLAHPALSMDTKQHVIYDDYLDGSEEFDTEVHALADAAPAATSYHGYGTKTIHEEWAPAEVPQRTAMPAARDHALATVSEVEGIPELPASPVPKRLTRDLVLSQLGPPSTPEETNSTELPEEEESDDSSGAGIKERIEETSAEPTKEEPAMALRQEAGKANRYSMLSQSLMDSSTVDLAVQFAKNSNATATGSTEDGMSDLLDGYQHTESKEGVATVDNGPPVMQSTKNKSVHTAKTSDEQSFKSCTDLPDPPSKDADARSFKTAKDTITPDRTVSMPASRLPSSNLAKPEPETQSPASDMPLTPPPNVLRKLSRAPPQDFGFSKMTSRMRANSRLSSRQGSTVTSISSSLDGVAQQTPVIPPRESSSSKEARRVVAVAEFLRKPFSRASSSIRRSPAEKESSGPHDTSTPQAQNVTPSIGVSSMDETSEVIQFPEQALAKQEVVHSNEDLAEPVPQPAAGVRQTTPVKVVDASVAPSVHHHSRSTPSPAIAESSSVYSPENISSSSRSRTMSSPAGLSKSPKHSHRDSLSTTHIVWQGPSSSASNLAQASELRSRQTMGQDDTTTNLRLSSYRPHFGYLPDVKEESHEDSSLNTSASNLKNSNFRFPLGGQRSGRASVDGGSTFGRNPSARSFRKSGNPALPAMQFSQMNLLAGLDGDFDFRTARSSEGAQEDGDALTRGRTASDGGMREKYNSVFSPLGVDKTDDDVQPAINVDLISFRRPSPKRFMSDIERVTIPTVDGLTQRISTYMPSFMERNGRNEEEEFPAEREIMKHAMEELQEVARPAPKRSSARLRPVAGSPNMVVIEDDVYEELTAKEKDTTHGDADFGMDTEETTKEVSVKSRSVAYTRSRERTPLAELEASIPANLPARSVSLGHRRSVESRVSFRRELQTHASTPTATTTETRPWNSDRNYPWATTRSHLDISLPTVAVFRNSPRPGPSPLRPRLSNLSERSSSSRQTLAARRKMSCPVNPAPGSFDSSGYPMGPVNDAGTSLAESEDETAAPRRSRFFFLRRDSAVPPAEQLAEGEGCTEPPPTAYPSSNPSAISIRNHEGEKKSVSVTQRRETYQNASGMPKPKYHRQDFIKRVKGMWHRVADGCTGLFRSVTGRPKKDRKSNAEGTAYTDSNTDRRIVPLTGTRGVTL